MPIAIPHTSGSTPSEIIVNNVLIARQRLGLAVADSDAPADLGLDVDVGEPLIPEDLRQYRRTTPW